jgi:glycine cleavage system transcriptional repressor
VRRWFALSAIGRDRPGIVADLAELVHDSGCNLEDSSMTILGSEFAVLLLLTGEGDDVEQRLAAGSKRLEWERRLTVFIRPLEGEPIPYSVGKEARPYELQATGVDKAGLVARVARCLADHGASIQRMSTRSRPEPGAGTPIYTMSIRLDVPAGVAEDVLRADLERVAAELSIDVSLSREF